MSAHSLPAYSAPVRLLVAISGGGTTLRNLLDAISDGRLAASIVHVIASKADCGGITHAEEAGVEVTVLPRARYESLTEYGAAFFDVARLHQCDLVIMAGFLAQVEVPDEYALRVLNIHPSLIPSFCGRGYYGLRVHRSVLERGCRVSGCTVHFVDNEYDHGPIIDQRAVPVLPDDTPESLAARVFEQECDVYPQTIADVAAGRFVVDGRRVIASNESNSHE